MHIITPEGYKIPLSASQVQLNNGLTLSLLEFIERRINVSWYETQSDFSLPELREFEGASQELQNLLDFTHEARLLTDHNGNVSLRLAGDYVAMSPRSVDKSTITAEDMIVVRVDQDRQVVFINDGKKRKSSIDSGVSDSLYRSYPSLNSLIHSHTPWVVGAAKTTFPYPCGVMDEGEEIKKTLDRDNYKDGNPFLIHLVNHGQLLGLAGELNLQKLQQQWKTVQADFAKHMIDIDLDTDTLTGVINPILSPVGIMGYVYVDEDGSVAPRLLEEGRGKGWGRDLLHVLKTTHSTIKTVSECGVEEFYDKHGFKKVAANGRIIKLEPMK